MAKTEFTNAELLILQIVLINYDPEYVTLRYPVAIDDLKQIIKNIIKKVSELLVAFTDPRLHPLASNRRIFDKHHDKIKGAIEIVEGAKSITPKNTAIFELIEVIEELCGKELIYPEPV